MQSKNENSRGAVSCCVQGVDDSILFVYLRDGKASIVITVPSDARLRFLSSKSKFLSSGWPDEIDNAFQNLDVSSQLFSLLSLGIMPKI